MKSNSMSQFAICPTSDVATFSSNFRLLINYMKNYIQARQPRQSTSVVLDFPGSPLLMDVIKHIVVLDHNNEEKCQVLLLRRG